MRRSDRSNQIKESTNDAVRSALRANRQGLTTNQISEITSLTCSAIYNALYRLPEVWIDSWLLTGTQGRPSAVWKIVPDNCPSPKASGRKKSTKRNRVVQ